MMLHNLRDEGGRESEPTACRSTSSTDAMMLSVFGGAAESDSLGMLCFKDQPSSCCRKHEKPMGAQVKVRLWIVQNNRIQFCIQ